ncbi:MAG: ATP synthase F0 subunit A [Bacteroidia bacterium]|nr:MAG: ATP synthase F0 subunit A [Bacteroidia bacterium]
MVVFLLLLPSLSFGSASHAASGEAGGEVSPVEIIFDHISDAHDWHLFSMGDTHVSIPLPVILYSRVRGEWFVFMSTRFHHGAEEHAGFRLARNPHESTSVLKIVEADGGFDAPLPLDFSLTKNVVGLFVSCVLLVLIFSSVAKRYKAAPDVAPKGLQNLLEPLILFVRDDIAVSSIGEEKAGRFVPFLLTVFFFILLNNLLGLIPIFPGGANLTGNISVTLVLALSTFILTSISGNRRYWGHIVNPPGIPMLLKLPVPIMPVVEFLGIFMKPLVLMIRLFANMLAGHMIVLVFVCLIFLFQRFGAAPAYGISVVSVIFMIFMTLLDVLVSFIQAYVFTMLSALYIGMATEEGH